MSNARILLSMLVPILILGACGKETPPPAPAALPRPLHAVQPDKGRISVPRKLLVERHGIPGVFVLQDGKLARFRMVNTGKIRNDQVEILSGLQGNESLVAGDLTFVMDGSPIEPLPAETARGNR